MTNLDQIAGSLGCFICTLLILLYFNIQRNKQFSCFSVYKVHKNPDLTIVILVGGTFALYSLICRYARVSLIPNHQAEDRELSNYRLDTPSNQLRRAQKIKEKLENSKAAQLVLFVVTILGTSMVIGDGVLTPCISGES